LTAALAVEDLVAEACARTGLSDFGDDYYREGLDVLLADVARAELSDLGGMVWRGRVLGHLVQRLRVEDWIARHRDLLAQPVPAPVFVVGLPRTGTTALSHLLAQDPGARSLRVWEAAAPVPPPEPDAAGDPRIAAAEQQLAAIHQLSPRLAAMHEDTATGPTENQDLLGMSFRTFHFEGMAWIPRYVAWWLACDMTPAYQYLKRVLQLLQSRGGPTRWHLKSPPDSFCLDAMLAVFPDARFVMTHRDPASVLGSVCSLIHTMHELTGRAPDPAALGRAELAAWTEAMRRLVAVRARIGEARFADVHFHELVADPVAVVARAYRQLAIPFPSEAERRIAAHAAAHPRGRLGEHRYRLEDWGLDRARVHEAFSFYTDRCGVKAEP
jgi:sulfotransferase family protein